MELRLDHLVMTVADVDTTVDWYRRVLGLEAETFGTGRRAINFAGGKINLHPAGGEFRPHAASPMPGSADLCFTTEVPLDHFVDRIAALGLAIEEGPVERTGSRRPLRSVYLRDPDGNLLEIANEI